LAETPSHGDADPGTLKGKLLVASPALHDPNFRRSIVLVTEHGLEGAMGLVLARAAPASVAEVAPALGPLVEPGALLYLGGPVQPEAVLVLAEFDRPEESAGLVLGDLGFVRGDADPVLAAGSIRRAQVFAGYAGWGAGQLESELAEPSWVVMAAEPDDVFARDVDTLWHAVLGRQGSRFALLASMPPDPSLN